MIVYASIPAAVALAFKIVLLAYSVRSPIKTAITRLFLSLLIILSGLNVIEVVLLNYYAAHGLTPWVSAGGFSYIALLMIAAPTMLHLVIALSFEEYKPKHLGPILWIYLPGLSLIPLLLFTDRLVSGFKPFMSYTILRVPGPWYAAVETIGVLYFSATLLILLYGARGTRPALLRIRNRLWLLGLAPMLLFLIYIIVVDYIGGVRLSAPLYLPIAMTFFLLVTTYATHERPRPGGFYRFLQCLFDLESFLPWSESYKRKSALYARLAEIGRQAAATGSIKQIVGELAAVLGCPVVLLGRQHRALARAGGATPLAHFPREQLQAIDRRVYAHQIVRTLPAVHALMARHRVAAIIPLHPHSRAASWMLLGEEFSEKIYSPFDFQAVEALFDRIGACFIDGLLRDGSAGVQPKVRTLRQQLSRAEQRLKWMQRRLSATRADGGSWRDGRDSAAATDRLTGIEQQLLEQAALGKRTLEECIAAIEARLIAQALERCGGNQARAAALLGLRANTLHYKIQRYGLDGMKKSG